ncbi:trypsin-like serine protease, partial [Ramicandelaber brevisporus]
HPDYQNGIPANNIAIVPLTGAVSFDATVQPIGVMPGPVADGDDNLFVFGWGATSGGGSPSSTLQRAAVTAGQTSKCQSNFQPFTGQDGNYVCVAFKKSGADTCVGDGGSPL